MKRIGFLTSITVLLCIGKLAAQNVFNQNDIVYTYDSTKPIGDVMRPVLPNNGVLAKWIRSKKPKVTFNTDSYKPYIWNGMPFRVLYPKTYQQGVNDGKKYPVVVFWHGGGEIGPITDNEFQLYNGGEFFMNQVASGGFDGFFIFPQETQIGWENSYFSRINSVLDSMQKYCKIDPDRVITMGLSIGAQGSFSYANLYPKRASRIVAASPSFIGGVTPLIPTFLQIPVWMASGGLDPNPDSIASRLFYQSFQQAGGSIIYDFFPNDDHKTWNDQWSKPYFLSQLNTAHKANPLVYFQKNQLCPDSVINVRMGLTPGFYAYQWDFNGTIINGATSSEYYATQFGTYRARFMRTATSGWSEWSPQPVVVSMKAPYNAPAVQIDGLHSFVVPAPDSFKVTPIKMPAGYQQYRWINAATNSIVSSAQVYNAPIGQYKGTVMDQSGCFAKFSPIYTVINANGPNKPDRPKNLSASAQGPNVVLLDWTKNPTSTYPATYYEIYRGTKAGGPYSFVGLVPATKLTFSDSTVLPGTTYYYIVRAINGTSASAVSNEASAITLNDTIAPTAPANLVAGATTRQSVALSWTAATDNVGVYKYDIYVNGVKTYSTDSTKFTVSNLVPKQPFVFVVKARDKAGNVSQPSNQVNASSGLTGLNYKFYQGYFYALPNFNTLTPVKTGTSPNVDISVRPSGVNDQFGFLWEGYINIATAGIYTFKLKSDDGSKLYINTFHNPNATAVVNNDGAHDNSLTKSGTYNFPQPGAYPICITFFEQGGGESIQVSYSGPGVTEKVIPNSAFSDNISPIGTVPAAPTTLTATANSFKKITLNWVDNSNNETGFEVVRSLSAAGPFTPLATTVAGANSYADTTLNPSTAYYYKVRSAGTGGVSAFTAVANATTQALPAPPAAPSGLGLIVNSSRQITLNWIDNSGIELGMEIYRSTNDASNYRLIATVSPNTLTYVDVSVFPNVTYYYKVRAKGNGNSSAYSNEVFGKTLNTKPVITKISDFTMKYGTQFVLPIKATDADSDDISFTFKQLPSFATVATIDNGSIIVTLAPPVVAEGTYTITAYAQDPYGGKDSTRFNLIVNNNNLPTINAISNVTINEGSTSNVNISANDPEGNTYIGWSFTGLPSFATFTNNGNGNGTIALAPGYAAAGVYNVTAIANDGFGGKASKTFMITVIDKSPNTKWLVNIKYNTSAPAPWNNIVASGNNLLNTAGQAGTVGVTISAPFGLSLYSFGFSTGKNSGYYPDAVLIDNFYLSRGNDTGNVLIRGLNPTQVYNFRMMSTTNNASETPTARTVFRINNKKDSVTVKNNSLLTAYIAGITPDASGNINMKWYRGAGTSTAYLNGFEIEQVYSDGTVPAKVQNIAATFIGGSGAKITWKDIAYNESRYSVYRSSVKAGTYTLLNPGATNQNDTSYMDATAVPSTTYYYYVQGSNSVGNSPASDTVMLVTGNNPPIVSTVNDLYVKAGSSATVSFTATDDPDDALTVTADDLPTSFVSLQPAGGSNYNLVANAGVDNIGFYTATVDVADDKGAVTKKTFNIFVSDSSVKTVLVKFGGDGFVLPSPWNNVSSGYPSSGLKIQNMVDDSKAATTFGVQLTSNFDGYFINGFRTGNNSGLVLDTVMYSGIYAVGVTTPRTFKLTGLDNTKMYSIGFVTSINTGYDAGIIISSGSQTVTGNARYNANTLPRLNGLVPVSGEIPISVLKTSTSVNAYINALIIQEYDPLVTSYVSPSNLVAEAVDTNKITLSWSDRSNNEAGFEISRSDTYGNGYTLLTTTDANVTTYTDNTANGNTRYYYKIRAVNGGDASAYSNIASAISFSDVVYVNMKTSNPGGGKWNNTGKIPDEGDVFTLNDAAGISTGYTLTIVNNFSGYGNGGSSTGGRNAGIFPDSVLVSNYTIAKGQTATITLSNLDQSKRYRIGFSGSSNTYGAYNTTYSINDRTVYLNGLYDTTKAVYIDNVIPNNDGSITANISSTSDAVNGGLLNALVIQSYTYVPGESATDNPVTSTAVKTNKAKVNEDAAVKDSLLQNTIVLKAYPNPFGDNLSLDVKAAKAIDKLSVEIYDSNGKLMFDKVYNTLPAGNNTIRFSTAEIRLTQGIYFMRVHSSDGTTNNVIKLIKVVK